MWGKPWETPFHPVHVVGDFWTMMNPAWQAQMFDQDKILETFRWMASADFDTADVIKHNRETMDRLAKANIEAVETCRQIAENLVNVMITETGRLCGNASNGDGEQAGGPASPFIEAQARATLFGLTLTRDMLQAAGKLAKAPL